MGEFRLAGLREVYGVMLRSVLLRGRAALYWAAIRGHSVWELLQPAPSTEPALGKKRLLAEGVSRGC